MISIGTVSRQLPADYQTHTRDVTVCLSQNFPEGESNKRLKMNHDQKFRVTGEGGIEGTMLSASRFINENEYRLFRLSNGREFYIPKNVFQPQPDGSYQLGLRLEELEKFVDGPVEEVDNETTQTRTIPEIEEQLEIRKEIIETGKIRVRKTVTASETVVDEPLFTESYDIDRVPINRIVGETTESRYEGETLILPIFEEVLVVEKRLILREEIRLTRKRTERRDPKTYTVRREHVEVDRQS